MPLKELHSQNRDPRMLSQKSILAIIFGLCALGILASVNYTDIASFTWTVANNTDIGSRFYSTKQYLTSVFVNGNSSSHLITTMTEKLPGISTQPLTSAIDTTSSTVLGRHFNLTHTNMEHDNDDLCKTTMTFNTTLVVSCKESPFIECRPPKLNITNNKFWKILYLRRPGWLSKSMFNVSACPFNQCQIDETSHENEADLIYVYGVGLHEKFKPPRQIKDTLYAIGLWESPIYSHSNFVSDNNSAWNSIFNIIMTYRVDADIFSPYNKLEFRPKPVNERPDYYAITKNKTKTVLWMVSHCRPQSKRNQYVDEMKKYVDVDIFGGCGKPCSKDECENLFSNYKFYLAFENSLCTDYVTEKFFKLFQPETYVIPVVRGGANYDKYFANFTYINAAHFTTPKDLAFYLKNLASDLATYSKYLEYKDLYVSKTNLGHHGCLICEYLHTHTFSKPKHYNLKSWLVDGHCFSPKDI